MTIDADEAYARWKGWGDPAAPSAADKKIWDALHALINLRSGQRVLEIGFGQGAHLHYCQTKGAQVMGLEQNKTGAKLARGAGLTVFEGGITTLPNTAVEFDVIVAMDVIEHIPLPELTPLLQHLRGLLKKDGAILLTFPNGASPFGRLQQHGDLTHINAFNRSSLEQLAILTGFQVTHYGDFPEYFPKSITQLIKAPLRALVRGGVKIAVRAYFNEPLGLAVAAVLKPA